MSDVRVSTLTHGWAGRCGAKVPRRRGPAGLLPTPGVTMAAFGFTVRNNGRVFVVDQATKVVVAEVPLKTNDYRGTEDAVDVADVLIRALNFFTAAPEGQGLWEKIRAECDPPKLE